MRNIVLTTGFIIIMRALSLSAQETPYCGFVYQSESQEPLAGVHISLDDSLYFTTGNEGQFCINTLKGQHILSFSFVAHETLVIDTILQDHTPLVILLNKKDLILPEVEVRANTKNRAEDLSTITLATKDILPTARILGESDPIKALSLFPGVSIGQEGSAGLYVRGGTPDQNLYLIDDVPIYNPNHFFGFISAINPNSIKNIRLYKGRIPASLGGRSSSVIDIINKEGNKNKVQGDYTIGLITNTATIEGPVIKDKMSFILSTRLTNVSVLTWPLAISFKNGNNKNYLSYNMYDINAKLTYTPNKTSKITFNMYRGQDRVPNWKRSGTSIDKRLNFYGNSSMSLKYNSQIRYNWFQKSTLYFSQYSYQDRFHNYEQNPSNKEILIKLSIDKSYLSDFGFKHKNQIYLDSKSGLDFGIDLSHFTVSPNHVVIESFTENNPSKVEKKPWEANILQIAPYTSYLYKNNFFTAEVGIRANVYKSKDYNDFKPEPRLSLGLELKSNHQINFTYTALSQPLHLLTSVNIGLPSETWVGSDATYPAGSSSNWGIEYVKIFNDKKGYLQLALFHRTMKNLIDYQRGVRFRFDAQDDYRDKVAREGIGRANGLELYLERNFSGFNLLFSSTISKSETKFEQINQRKWTRNRYDRLVDINLSSMIDLSDKMKLTTSFIYSTGFPVTIPESYMLPLFGNTRPIFPTRFNAQSPDYWRLDVQLSKYYVTRRNNKAFWSVGLYNALLKINPSIVEITGKFKENDDGLLDPSFRKKGHALLNFVPSFSIGRSF